MGVGVVMMGGFHPARGTAGRKRGKQRRKSPTSTVFCQITLVPFYLLISRWEDIPALQSSRWGHAAVRVPGHGILAIGGKNGKWLEEVELLQLSGEDEDVTSWRQMAPMLQPKDRPSACYFRGFVFVCSSRYRKELDLEVFDAAAGATGQWTRVACQFSSDFWRYLLPQKGSLWIIGNSIAPSIL